MSKITPLPFISCTKIFSVQCLLTNSNNIRNYTDRRIPGVQRVYCYLLRNTNFIIEGTKMQKDHLATLRNERP